MHGKVQAGQASTLLFADHAVFTAPRHDNRRSWLYRMRPTADHRPFVPYGGAADFVAPLLSEPVAPNRLRWDPPADLPSDADFVDGLVAMLGNRHPGDLTGVAVHLYRASKSMARRLFMNADAEMLIIPQQGTLHLFTEMGRMDLAPGWIGVVPRGTFVCELPGNAAGRAGVAQPERNITIESASRYSSPQGSGSYLRRGDTLTLTSGPRQGESYAVLSNDFLRLIEDGKAGRLRCVRQG